MESYPFISIIIPLFNKEESIQGTLTSVLNQTYTDFEVYVINDGSTDSSASKVKEIEETDSRVHLISKQNGGVSSARNVGIDASRGEYVAFLDADDIWDKSCLFELASMAKDFPDAAMCGVNYGETINSKIIRDVPTGLPQGYRGYVENYFQMPGRVSDLFCSSSVLIRRETFKTSGKFDERLRYAEDTDMWWRIIALFPIAFYDKYLVSYRFDAENRAQMKARPLRYFLPMYSDKYRDLAFSSNKDFYIFAQRWCAQHVALFYFTQPSQRKDASSAAKRLDFSVLPPKYRLLLCGPYAFSWCSYKLICLIKKFHIR